MNKYKRYGKRARGLYRILIVICVLAIVLAVAAYYLLAESPSVPEVQSNVNQEAAGQDPEAVVDGIHLRTGLVVAEGYHEVINNCTGCHSAELIIQNRMNSQGWEATIKWMQETQNLWDLGDSEAVIIKYLVTNYPVETKGRREALKDINWYRLEPDGP